MFALIEENKVVKAGTLSELFPNISFPESFEEKKAFIKENNLVEVEMQLDFDDFQEKAVICEPYLKNKKAYIHTIEKLTDEEKKETVNAHIDFELISVDWITSDKDIEKKSLKVWQSYKDMLEAFRDSTSMSEVKWPKRPDLSLEKIKEEVE